jgi:hypothetical protein
MASLLTVPVAEGSCESLLAAASAAAAAAAVAAAAIAASEVGSHGSLGSHVDTAHGESPSPAKKGLRKRKATKTSKASTTSKARSKRKSKPKAQSVKVKTTTPAVGVAALDTSETAKTDRTDCTDTSETAKTDRTDCTDTRETTKTDRTVCTDTRETAPTLPSSDGDDTAKPTVKPPRTRPWRYVIPLNTTGLDATIPPVTTHVSQLTSPSFCQWLTEWIVRTAFDQMAAAAAMAARSRRAAEAVSSSSTTAANGTSATEGTAAASTTAAPVSAAPVGTKRKRAPRKRKPRRRTPRTDMFAAKRYSAKETPMTPELQQVLQQPITEPVIIYFDHTYETPEAVHARQNRDPSLPPVKGKQPRTQARYTAELSYCEPKKGTLTYLRFIEVSDPVTPERKGALMGLPDEPVIYHSLAHALCLAANYPGTRNPRPTFRANARTKWRRTLPGGTWQPLCEFMDLFQFSMTRAQARKALRGARKPPAFEVQLPKLIRAPAPAPLPDGTPAPKRKPGRPFKHPTRPLPQQQSVGNSGSDSNSETLAELKKEEQEQLVQLEQPPCQDTPTVSPTVSATESATEPCATHLT